MIAIEECKYLTQLFLNELTGSLQSHEQRMNTSDEKKFEQSFPTKTNISRGKSHGVENFSHEEILSTRGRGRGKANRGGRS